MEIKMPGGGRSFGLKLILVGALAFLLWLPAMLVYGLVFERSTRADEVRRDIYERAGGEQSISGPVIIAPATVETGKRKSDGEPVLETVFFTFTPKELSIDAAIDASQRRRSLYEATVYDADIIMTGKFEALAPPAWPNDIQKIHWDCAILALKLGDNSALKGIRNTPTLVINNKPHDGAFEPGVMLTATGRYNSEISQTAPGISTGLPITAPEQGFQFQLVAPMSGGGSLYFSPVGEETSVTMRANWPDPSFQGAYLPDTHNITAEGFVAEWRIPYLARNLPRSFAVEGGLTALDAGNRFGVVLIDAASPYQSVNRALKYALMFLGAVFLTFFIFEVMTNARAHPAQYILLGLAQVIFYLLVLAFSEHFGFEAAFFGSAAATVLLSSAYAATVFHSFLRGLIALIAFSGAYGLIYLLMKSEDYALLIGSVTAFGAIALTMYVTRHLDWYGARKPA
ncbi:cell envelope integrity protein CreD [Hyphococcus flavus]|uniref:Cell envelope integrity protein CreD n=1 Tax=Hyphococcus flavus TaxID=1866326 RepID=A0AAF0CH40_9PROT|nr:cell envelope integrity protein CreD [Hyphococcus flavus]WDI33013.1 cell envelope integrity protein CreD [Hyphococcus flavus]